MNHHRLFNHIWRTDEWTDVSQSSASFRSDDCPFPTALLAAYYYSGDRIVAAAVFNFTYVLIAICFNVLWHHAVRRGLIDSSSGASTSRQYAMGPISYLICFGVGWVSVPASFVLNIAMAVFFAMPPKKSADNRA